METKHIAAAESIVQEMRELFAKRFQEHDLHKLDQQDVVDLIIGALASFTTEKIASIKELTGAPIFNVYKAFDDRVMFALKNRFIEEMPAPVSDLLNTIEAVMQRMGEDNAKQRMH
jgi:hypothetical protein